MGLSPITPAGSQGQYNTGGANTNINALATPNIGRNGVVQNLGEDKITAENALKLRRIILKENITDPFSVLSAGSVSLKPNSGLILKKSVIHPMLSDSHKEVEGLDFRGAVTKGNLFGSSRDLAVIQGKIPTLGEQRGRVNRLDVTQVEIQATIKRYGIFTEITQDEFNHNQLSDLWDIKINSLNDTAIKLRTLILVNDLISGAGQVFHPAGCVDLANLGLSGTNDLGANLPSGLITYSELSALNKVLNAENAPLSSGSSHLPSGAVGASNSKIVSAGRNLFIHPDLVEYVSNMKNSSGEKVFTPAVQYKVMDNMFTAVSEIGTIDSFRIFTFPDMPFIRGAKVVDTSKANYFTYNPVQVEQYGDINNTIPQALSPTSLNNLYSTVTALNLSNADKKKFGKSFIQSTGASAKPYNSATDTLILDSFNSDDIFKVRYKSGISLPADEYYKVYTMLLVSQDSFETIRFQSKVADGTKSNNGLIVRETKFDADSAQPFGSTKTYSLEWYYATLITKPLQIASLFTLCPK